MTPHTATAARAPWLLEQPYAHRGLWHVAHRPENSMAAFKAAHEAGLGVELDVQLSADGEAVVFHDPTLDRMTKAHGALLEKTAAEIAAIRLGEFSETIPLLGDVLDALPDTPLLVEMKVPSGREGPLETRTAELLGPHKGPVAVMSFNPRALEAFAAHAPNVARGQLFSAWPGASGAAMQWLKRAVSGSVAGADFLASGLDALFAHGRPAARKLDVPLLAWTVKTVTQLRHARAHAQQIIFEHLPPKLAAQRRGPYI